MSYVLSDNPGGGVESGWSQMSRDIAMEIMQQSAQRSDHFVAVVNLSFVDESVHGELNHPPEVERLIAEGHAAVAFGVSAEFVDNGVFPENQESVMTVVLVERFHDGERHRYVVTKDPPRGTPTETVAIASARDGWFDAFRINHGIPGDSLDACDCAGCDFEAWADYLAAVTTGQLRFKPGDEERDPVKRLVEILFNYEVLIDRNWDRPHSFFVIHHAELGFEVIERTYSDRDKLMEDLERGTFKRALSQDGGTAGFALRIEGRMKDMGDNVTLSDITVLEGIANVNSTQETVNIEPSDVDMWHAIYASSSNVAHESMPIGQITHQVGDSEVKLGGNFPDVLRELSVRPLTVTESPIGRYFVKAAGETPLDDSFDDSIDDTAREIHFARRLILLGELIKFASTDEGDQHFEKLLECVQNDNTQQAEELLNDVVAITSGTGLMSARFLWISSGVDLFSEGDARFTDPLCERLAWVNGTSIEEQIGHATKIVEGTPRRFKEHVMETSFQALAHATIMMLKSIAEGFGGEEDFLQEPFVQTLTDEMFIRRVVDPAVSNAVKHRTEQKVPCLCTGSPSMHGLCSAMLGQDIGYGVLGEVLNNPFMPN